MTKEHSNTSQGLQHSLRTALRDFDEIIKARTMDDIEKVAARLKKETDEAELRVEELKKELSSLRGDSDFETT